MEETILGIDIGTSSIKCSLFNFAGKELFLSGSNYSLENTFPGAFEIDTESLWKALVKAIKKTTLFSSEKKYRIVAVGACAMMIMPVLMDRKNNVIRPVIHWFDERLQKQYYKIKKEKKDVIISKISGSSLTGESTANALDWIKENEPQNYTKISKFFMIKDFVGLKLTGRLASDYGDASGSQMLDTKKWQWPLDKISLLGFKNNFFPELYKPGDIRGYITREAAELTGLTPGTPVAIGSGDGITTIFGLGIYKDGDIGITVGSAGVIAAATTKFPRDDKFRTYIFCHPLRDRWYSLMATASSGEIFKWYLKSILKNPKLSFAMLDKEAASVKPGAEGILFLPYLLGSRNPYSNPQASAVFLGLRYKHEQKHLSRAVLEGISFELMDLLKVQEEILEKANIKPGKIKISGGITRSKFWMQLLADILQKDLVTTSANELGTLGSAIMAATAAGIYQDMESALGKMVNDKSTILYNPELKEIYTRKFELFRQMYKNLEKKFHLFV